MLASVLNSAVAVQASVYVVRVFVQMRTMVAEYAKLSHRIDALERKYDASFKTVFDAFRQLIKSRSAQRPIGFVSGHRQGASSRRH